MTVPVRLRLSRVKGFDLQALSLATNGLEAVNVARPSRWGNRATIMACWCHGGIPSIGRGAFTAKNRDEALAEGRLIAVTLFREHQAPHLDVAPLRGKNLACWCAPEEAICHAETLLELANRPICEGA